MKTRLWTLLFALVLFCVSVPALSAQEAQPGDAPVAGDADKKEALPVAVPADPQRAVGESSAVIVSGGGTSKGEKISAPAPIEGATKIDGLIPLYLKGTNLYAELGPDQYGSEFLVLISIARGIGRNPLLGGMSWGFGDDWVWKFQKVDDRVLVIRRNVRFRAGKGTPEERAVELAYTDSVLYSLPAETKGPGGGDLVDLTPIFMSDLPQISTVLPGFAFASNKSAWASVKGFKDNVELQVAATYASGGQTPIESVADSRGVTLHVHYSISKIPQTGYQARMADDRVGYFLTVIKDYSRPEDDDHFVRYINRWDLQKADASAKLSPPKQPIIFWLEKTIPYKYRKPLGDGILEWNKAFEQAGFVNAIEVRQQPDDATWDPEDINYNTFRWITSSAGFAMGPSRVNPYTGQILDADIIFDADFLQSWREYFRMNAPGERPLTGGPIEAAMTGRPHPLSRAFGYDGPEFTDGMAMQFALAEAAVEATETSPEKKEEEMEKIIAAGLKSVATHEVGHTLGLRHNFRASAWLTLEQLSDPAQAEKTGLAASVMDYLPVYIAPKGVPQGPYFSSTLGPYDLWAIQYGYTPFAGGTQGEGEELKKLAVRSGDPALAYATDEDISSVGPDPLVNRFDLGSDLFAFARMRAQLVRELLPGLLDRMIEQGESYDEARQAYNALLSTHGNAMCFVSRFVGGIYTSRSHKGDENAKPPFVPVEPAKQREALTLMEEQMFSEKPFMIEPDVFNYLAPSPWNHWGMQNEPRPDYPIHDVILSWQVRVLDQLLGTPTLSRMIDIELKVPADQDALTVEELLDRLTKSIFSELETVKEGEFTNRKPAVSSLRRNLQREYLRRLANLAVGLTAAPPDCRTVAYEKLAALKSRIDAFLQSNVKLDPYTRAHLQEASARIGKALEAQVSLGSPF